jgi:hypothetical protein
LNETELQRWHWWGLAASRGSFWAFLDNFPSLVNRFEYDPSLASVVFTIGRALRGHIDTEKGEIFDDDEDFDNRIGPANRAIDFFTAQCAAARRAVDMWCLMTVRINIKVNRDVRKKIGMMIWDARKEANYSVAKREESI